MKKFLLTCIMAVISFGLFTTKLNAQEFHVYEWKGNPNLVRTDIGGISVCFPKECKYRKDISKPEEGNYVWMTPDKSFLFICCLFETDESFSQEERLIGEAAEMGFEVTGEGDIANMKLSDDKYLSFCFTDNVGIGVCNLFPETHTGVCLYVIMQDATEDDTLISEVLASIRLSEE